jgi:hypothetical protein
MACVPPFQSVHTLIPHIETRANARVKTVARSTIEKSTQVSIDVDVQVICWAALPHFQIAARARKLGGKLSFREPLAHGRNRQEGEPDLL